MAASSIGSAVTKRLKGKVALITGAASGIGECTARIFALHGAKVTIADIQDERGCSVRDSIGSSDTIYVHCDVTSEEQVKAAVDTAVSTFGKLDILFANAGTIDPNKDWIMDNEKTEFERVLATNVTGVFLGMKHAARVMVPSRSGSIISTSSLCSGLGGVGPHAYTASKHAVVGLTKNLAVELGPFGIRVNCLSPYGAATPLSTSFCGLDNEAYERTMCAIANLKGPTFKTEDVANAALFLASDEARYISGQNLFIDGGAGTVNPNFNMFRHPESS